MNENVTFESLSGSAKVLSSMIIMGSADYVFKLWPDGQIADVMLSDEIRAVIDPGKLKHRQIQAIVEPEFVPEMTDILRCACRGQTSSPIRVRHSDLIGQGSSALYSAHLFEDGRNVMLIGKSLSPEMGLAQQAANAEIEHSLGARRAFSEKRYQHLFSASREGLVIVDVHGLIEDANANAEDALGSAVEDLVGSPFIDLFDDESSESLSGLLEAQQDTANALAIPARLRTGGRQVSLSCRFVRSLLGISLFVRVVPVESPEIDDDHETRIRTIELLRKTGASVLLIDAAGLVTWANDASYRLFPGEQVTFQSAADLLGISSQTFDLVRAEAKSRGRVLTLLSALSDLPRTQEDAHLWIIPVPADASVGYGVILRPATGDDGMSEIPEQAPEHSALAELVGQAPMKKLVRRSTEHLERSCIQAALRLTGNNRAAAASALGLSRQSLYLKMRQFDLL